MTKVVRASAILLATVALSLSACGKGKHEGKEAPPPAAKPVDRPAQPPAAELTDQQFSAKVVECWAAFDARDDAKLSTCYTDQSEHVMVDHVPPRAAKGFAAIRADIAPIREAFPDMKDDLQLVLVNGKRAAVVYLAKGTNTGSLMGAPPTGKRVGYLGVQLIDRTDAGEVASDRFLYDQSTIMGQLGLSPAPHPPAIEALGAEPTIVIAAGGEPEQANVALVKAGFEAFNAHDVDALIGYYADDAVFKYVPEKDEVKGKQAFAKTLTGYFAMSSDVKTELSAVWAAGDYVVVEGVSSGTHDGDMGELKATAKPFRVAEVHVYELRDGKIHEHWAFANSMAFAVQVGLIDPAKMQPAQPATE